MPMSGAISFHILFMPLAVLALVSIDYLRVHSTDDFMRKIFVSIAAITFCAVLSEVSYDIVAGMTERRSNVLLHITCFAYYVLQVGSFHAMNLFCDYAINHDQERTQKMAVWIGAIMVTHFVTLLLNLKYGFYYNISPENQFMRGPLYIVHVIYAALPLPIIFLNAFLSRKHLHRADAPLILMPILWIGSGSVMDVLLGTTKMVWPCYCIAMLFFYFFIIRRDSFSDALTGINNRRSCEEYLRNIGTTRRHQYYGFIMIDLDKFKQINDIFGHAQGDVALVDAAQLLRNCLRRSDFVARYGGDEFLIISPMNQDVQLLVDRITTALVEYNARGHRPFELQMSMGYDTYHPDNHGTPQEFIAHVDTLMYQRKNRRRAEA